MNNKQAISGKIGRGTRNPQVKNAAALGPATLKGARSAPFPETLSPMLAALTDAPFSSPDWFYEPKLDGYRTIALTRDKQVVLRSRRGLDSTSQFPYLAEALKRQPGELVLDGEIVALDSEGKPCFQCLQQSKKSGVEELYSIIYYVFDLLYLNGYDLRDVPLYRRKLLLDGALRRSERVRYLEHFEGDGRVIYESAVKNGFEGIIAKQKESKYEPGRRSKSWLKVKAVLSDEFVIAGYTEGLGSRMHTFGALLLGTHDKQGQLIYAGHVGSGFDEEKLVSLKKRMDAIKLEKMPFTEMPKLTAPATWLKPEIVAEVKFSEWTREGYLRAPVFLRLREDKTPGEVYRVESAPAPDPGDESLSGDVDVLEQLKGSRNDFNLKVDGHTVKLSNLDKELWPAHGKQRTFTKRDLLIYLAMVAKYLLPQLHDRPITLSRYPEGVQGERFYQKHYRNPLPGYVATVRLHSEHKGALQEYLMCNNLPSLLWLGQMADIELHTWFSRMSTEPDLADEELSPAERTEFLADRPDFMIFDLDPYIYAGTEAKGDEPALNRKAFAKTCEVALWLKEVLDGLSLAAFVKTSGRTGLHVYVPIKRQYSYLAVRSAAGTIGKFLMERHPEDITLDWVVGRRAGKVFVDYNQNVRGKTLACAYSPRPSPEATVSTPLRWDELKEIYPTDFTIISAPERLKKSGDIWEKILESKRELVIK